MSAAISPSESDGPGVARLSRPVSGLSVAGTPPHGDAALQRADGAARVALARRDGRTVPAGLYQRSPCRVLLPRTGGGCELVLLNTAGGVAGGDRLRVDIAAGEGTHATATTQAAEKIYRALDATARMRTGLSVAPGASLRWLPQETILFDGGRLDRRSEIAVSGDGCLVALEWLVLGRAAHGETVRAGSVAESWRVRCDGRLVWADGFRLDGDIAAQAGRRALLGGARAVATVIQVGGDAAGRLDGVRACIEGAPVEAGASMAGGVLVCRLLASEPRVLRGTVTAILGVLEGAEDGPPRMWNC